jgi:hypothetical protein
MPILMGRVVTAFIRRPLRFPDGQAIFALELEDAAGAVHRLVAQTQPDIFDAAEKPTTLAAEVGPGSRVRVDAQGFTMRAVQLLELRTENPFRAPKPSQDAVQSTWDGLDWLGGADLTQARAKVAAALPGIVKAVTFRADGTHSIEYRYQFFTPHSVVEELHHRVEQAIEAA